MPAKQTTLLLIGREDGVFGLAYRVLKAQGYRIERASDLATAFQMLDHVLPELVLCDFGLFPNPSLCQRLRERSGAAVIACIPAQQRGLIPALVEQGVDDLLLAPFYEEELLARVTLALARRSGAQTAQVPLRHVQVGSLTIDLDLHLVRRHGQPVPMSRIDWALLELLVRNAGKVVPYRMLLQEVWGPAYRDEINYLRTYINRLRNKLEDDPTQPRYLLTEPRIGYRFVALTPEPSSESYDSDLPSVADSRPRLPIAATTFVGRATELAQILALLRQPLVRLVTLFGPGGVGKTRLALQVAHQAPALWPGGAVFVPLAPLRDPQMLLPTIAQALQLKVTHEQRVLEQLVAALQGKHCLLILDNFEHLIQATPQVGELLEAIDDLRVLVTSRRMLHLSGEQVYPVTTLPIPEDERLVTPAMLQEVPSVALFVDRARAVNPSLTLTPDNAPVIAAICRRLEGLPLAIELAAARTRLLSPAQLLERLDQQLDLLVSQQWDLPERHQTLRNTVKWSYDLLSPLAQQTFARLAVFADGATLPAIQAVCFEAEQGHRDVETLTELIEASLVQRELSDDDQPRLSMLAVIHDYARELLDAEELGRLQERHAAFYLALAEQAQPYLQGPQQRRWLARLERERANLRAACAWTLAQGHTDLSLRFIAALWQWWHVRGDTADVRPWVDQLLRQTPPQNSPVYAQALYGAGWLAYDQRDIAQAEVYLRHSLELFRRLNQMPWIAEALRGLGELALQRGDYLAAQAALDESLSLSTQLGSLLGQAWSLNQLGRVALEQGASRRAETLLKRSLALFQIEGEQSGQAWALHTLGRLALDQGDAGSALTYLEQGLALFRELGDSDGIAWSLHNLGRAALEQGQLEQAATLLEQSRALFQRTGNLAGAAWTIYSLGRIAVMRDQLAQAQQWFEISLHAFRRSGERRGEEWAAYQLRCLAFSETDEDTDQPHSRAQRIVDDAPASAYPPVPR
ncbi:tetratricopeptide repeat protein [Kallotenue papyrolyticum]|uniref:tetratricopeptide repeat protein n=1 Tax=Kallotenue papyrolyticum TaxID=1325125 RepID=UPI00049252FA|nr:tetratricopeptide repeat protein [Kallotenue papyrolyticum]